VNNRSQRAKYGEEEKTRKMILPGRLSGRTSFRFVWQGEVFLAELR
jgi:hypothetical protein